MEIQSKYCLYLPNGLVFFITVFLHSDQRFRRNIFKPLSLNFETSAHVQLEISA